MLSESYGSMNVAALKDVLRERGLATGGKKAELVKRLEDADEEKADAAAVQVAAVSSEKESAPADENTEAAPPVADNQATPEVADENAAHDPISKRIQRFGSSVLSDEEKAKKREARFNPSAPSVDAGTLEKRAARFGIETEESKKQKEMARAKRFQLETPEIVAEKKRAREERFKQPVPETKQVPLTELEAMIKKRT